MKHHSENAERAVIGAVFFDPECLDRIDLSADEFYNPKNRAVIRAMRAVSARGGLPTDVALLADELGELVSALGGIGYVTECHGVPSMLDAYTSKIRSHATTRRVLEYAGSLSTSGLEGTELIEAAYERLGALVERGKNTTRTGPELVANAVRQMHEAFDVKREGKEVRRGLPTGLAKLDDLLGGLSVGNVTVFAGNTSIGKSSLARTTIEAVLAGTEHGVHLFSMEDEADTYTVRRISAESMTPVQDLMNFDVTSYGLARLQNAANDLHSRKRLLVDDEHGLAASTVAMRVRRHKKQNSTKLVVVDFIQQMYTKDVQRSDKGGQVDAAMDGLVGLARSEDVAVIAVSQLNRDSGKEDREPKLHDLYRSGKLEQDSRAVVFVHADSRGCDTRDIILAKNKNGQTGKFRVPWNGPLTKFG